MRPITKILVLIEELEGKVLSLSKEDFELKEEFLRVLRELRKKILENELKKL